MRTESITIAAADANGISVAQTPAGAGELTLTGALTSTNPHTGKTEWVADVPRLITITSDGNDSGVAFTITGETANGVRVTEAITGPSSTTVPSVNVYERIVSIAINGAGTGNN